MVLEKRSRRLSLQRLRVLNIVVALKESALENLFFNRALLILRRFSVCIRRLDLECNLIAGQCIDHFQYVFIVGTARVLFLAERDLGLSADPVIRQLDIRRGKALCLAVCRSKEWLVDRGAVFSIRVQFIHHLCKLVDEHIEGLLIIADALRVAGRVIESLGLVEHVEIALQDTVAEFVSDVCFCFLGIRVSSVISRGYRQLSFSGCAVKFEITSFIVIDQSNLRILCIVKLQLDFQRIDLDAAAHFLGMIAHLDRHVFCQLVEHLVSLVLQLECRIAKDLAVANRDI